MQYALPAVLAYVDGDSACLRFTSVTWLTFDTLHIRLPVSGKVNAVQALRTRLLQTAPHFATATFVEAVRAKYGDTYENLIREHTHHILFLACVVEFNQWREIFARRPAADKTPSAAVAAIANGGDRTPWLVQFQRATSSVTETFGDVLTTTSTLSWLQDDVESFGNAMPEGYDAERRREEVQVLRGMYVPWLVQTMHHVLSSSAAYIPGYVEQFYYASYFLHAFASASSPHSNHREAMRLTMTVANEDHQLYREFLAGGDHARLESLLLAVRDDALELLDREGVAFPAE